MIFDPKKRGGHFLPPLHPPPPSLKTPPPLPQNLKKVGFKWGGVWGGPDQKLIGGCIYWAK